MERPTFRAGFAIFFGVRVRIFIGPRLFRAMNELQNRFLALLGRPPARLTVEQAAWVLGCQAHDVPVLVAAKLLKPLGAPAANASKFFATSELLEATADRSFLAKITNTISRHWQEKNARKKSSREALAPISGDAPLTLVAAGR